MTGNRHPNEVEAHDLIDNPRFCEYLDANNALGIGWPHSPSSTRRWFKEQCDVELLGQLDTYPEAAASLAQIAKRFQLWERNEELEV